MVCAFYVNFIFFYPFLNERFFFPDKLISIKEYLINQSRPALKNQMVSRGQY